MAKFSVEGRNVTVVGGARSGIAAALLLVERGARTTLTDSRPALDRREDEARLRDAGVAVELGGHQPETFRRAGLIVLSPGVPLSQPHVAEAQRAGIPVIGEIELASRWLSGRIVAITGTKGKSTTTTLTGKMFVEGGRKALVGGNIGTPLSSQVADSTPDTFHIVEVSSFQLETTSTFHPWVAVFLNLSPDHLDRHADFDEYSRAKARIFSNQTGHDFAVINADDPRTLAAAQRAVATRVLFSPEGTIAEGIVIRSGVISDTRMGREAPLVPLSSIRLIGRHLTADVMAAAAVARLAGIPSDAMTRAVESFSGLEHALEPVAEIGGVRFVNDSKATNVEAARRAIESFDHGLVAIMGGRFKGGDLSLLVEPLRARRGVVVAIGEAQALIAEALGGAVPVHTARTMSDAVRQAFTLAPVGGTVLLSPACASFDMFHDYADRGKVFKREVKKLESEASATREQ